MDSFAARLPSLAPVVLRIGLSLVFLWFGFQQLIDAQVWTSWVPDFVVGLSPIGVVDIVHLNGAFEVVFGLALLVGFYVRTSAFLLAAHMFDIAFMVGLSAIGVRDFGLAFGTLAVFLYGADWLTLDQKLARSANLAPTA